MKTAKELAQEARDIVMEGLKSFNYDVKDCDEAFDKLVVFLHEAMTQPAQLGDKKPTEEGAYWYEFRTGAMIVQIKQSDAVYYNNQYIGDVDILSKTGRWSPRLTVAGGKG